ncbi:MAG: penicillin acylase family protein [Gaiellales bacterium]
MRRAVGFGIVVAAAAAGAALGAGRTDFAAEAWNVLPPGQAGGVAFTKNSTDQAKLYDGLTPLRDNVTAATVRKQFKREPLGLGAEKAVSTERPRKGLTITRDRWGVPHIVGKTDVDVAFGAGYATAQDRQLIMELLRGPGRIAALDAPGVNAFSLALAGKTFVPSPATESRLNQQFDTLLRAGPDGRRLARLIDAYVAGINTAYKKAGLPITPWTRTDVVAIAGLIGGLFGAGGGDETTRSDFLARLQAKLGAEVGRQVWEDLRLRDDPEARTAVEPQFVYGASSSELGNVVVDAGSFVPEGGGPPALASESRPPAMMSNALLVSAKRSATGHPLAVMGPQVGYYYPQILLELDLQGGGYQSRGAAFPGISFAILLGRGPDYAWSATSAGSDVVDQYAETLCDGSSTKYLFNGSCREMTSFDAGIIRGAPGTADVPLTYRETVHGPVIGYATVGGVRVAISTKRSTRGRELLAGRFFLALSTGEVTSAKSFFKEAATMEMSFNWHYVDAKDIAVFTSGRLPVRPATVDPGLPTKGTGAYEWQGFVPSGGHAQQVNPRSGLILNWNNKPARGYSASDSEWSYGPVQRVDLLWNAAQRKQKHTLATLVGAMNLAATQDLRVVRVWPAIRAVLDRGTAPTDRARTAATLVDTWLSRGGSRLDGDLDGKIDDPGAAILDAAWGPLTDAVLSPVLGAELVQALERFATRDDAPARGGSSYIEGWYSYVDKDLRTLLGRPVQKAFVTKFCGKGNVVACTGALWAALDKAAAGLEATQGPSPSDWHSNASPERITFAPGILPTSMRWTNRPTFQQVISFDGHR